MGSRGDAYDNAQAESFMSTLKTELVDRRSWPTRDDARRAIFDYIEGWYNPRRRHSALGYMSLGIREDHHQGGQCRLTEPVHQSGSIPSPLPHHPRAERRPRT
jgi:putative transposase